MATTAIASQVEFLEYLSQAKKRVDRALADALRSSRAPGDDLVHQSMEWSLLSGGKRIRPILTLAVTEMLHGDVEGALPGACAVELLHCASLILDDLPCMDDAKMRRGKAANHVEFGEDVAILGAINLLNLAYRLVLTYSAGRHAKKPQVLCRMLTDLNRAIGVDGLIGGQLGDLHPENLPRDFGILNTVYERKTVCLFAFSVEMGALLAGADDAQFDALSSYARHLGLAFQVYDDLLDLQGDSAVIGKDTMKDGGKQTVLNMTSAGTTARMASELIEYASQQLELFGERSRLLRQLPAFLFDSLAQC